jgi:hypothetical protein
MATTQVKFYSKAEMPTENVDQNGLYFIQNGELYKGSKRFGLGRVTIASSTTEVVGAERGDIVVTGSGAGWVYAGSEAGWKSIGGDIGTITSAWKSDISASLSGLSVGDANSYITNITQNADGSVTANAAAFPSFDYNPEASSASDDDGGIYVTVTTQSGAVTGVSVSADNLSVSTVTAETGNFTNLNVSDTATFSATTVSATTLTIGGSTVEQLADKQIAAISASTKTSSAAGITVGVTTQGGSVTSVSVDASTFTNVMHFLGVGSVSKTASGVDVTPPAGKTPVAGDIVIDSETGLEAICTGTDPSTTWELIGDNAVYALNAYTSTATVYANVETLPGAVNAAGAAIDALKTKTDAYVGGTSSSEVSGITTSVTIASATMAPTVSLAVDAAALSQALGLGTAASKNYADEVTANAATLPTCSAVASYVGAEISGLNSTVSTSTSDSNVDVTIVQSAGVLTSVTATINWITD